MSENLLTLNMSFLRPEVTKDDIRNSQPQISEAIEQIEKEIGPGSDFLGWKEPSELMPQELLTELSDTAASVQDKCDTLVVIGIGGSYLGARAVIEALRPRNGVEVVYAGNSLSPLYHRRLLEDLEDKEFCVNVISKSGTTTEPAVVFRMLRALLEEKYGQLGAAERIVATTDAARGALRTVSDSTGYKTFVIPDNVGGRYSVLTPVGLLPIACAGCDINEIVRGAVYFRSHVTRAGAESLSAQYAAARDVLYSKGKAIEIITNFTPRLHMFSEWWKQLYGESEGKENKGIYPASADFTTDLHSLGQWIQEGTRNIFETFVIPAKESEDLPVSKAQSNEDGLDYLAGENLSEINRKAYQGTAVAHRSGGVPNMTLQPQRIDEGTMGQMIYFFEYACALSGYMLGVNPFNQPGVEAYKTNMFALLGKSGFDQAAKDIERQMADANSWIV